MVRLYTGGHRLASAMKDGQVSIQRLSSRLPGWATARLMAPASGGRCDNSWWFSQGMDSPQSGLSIIHSRLTHLTHRLSGRYGVGDAGATSRLAHGVLPSDCSDDQALQDSRLWEIFGYRVPGPALRGRPPTCPPAIAEAQRLL